jgi:hypothetical protein
MSERFYHGGPAGLSVILPPSITGTASSASFGAEGVCKRDRVYVTTSLAAAVGFASLCPPDGNGAVYEVRPADLSADPDCDMPGLSFEASSAQVLRRVPVSGKQLKKARRVWSANSPIQGGGRE